MTIEGVGVPIHGAIESDPAFWAQIDESSRTCMCPAEV
jgi:hypothetical protein